MGTYTATIEWTRNESEFKENRCRKPPTWRFVGGPTVPATKMPRAVPVPSSDPADLNPEEAFVAALSSSHMWRFLHIATMFGYIVDYYSDTPEVSIATNSDEKPWVTNVVLQPVILFTGANVPTEADVLSLHHAAHAECSLANALNTSVQTWGVWHHEPCVA